MSASLGEKAVALDTRSDFILSLKDCKLDDKKKCDMESEVQNILEALEEGRYEVQAKDLPCVPSEVASQSLGASHDFLPRMSDLVEVEYDPARGRFAVASKFIPAGTVLIVEPPVASITREEAAHRYCDLCYRQIKLGLVPCPGCAEVAYCSAQCREKAFGEITSSPFLPLHS